MFMAFIVGAVIVFMALIFLMVRKMKGSERGK
jgi:hypothetical protein